MWLFIFEDKVDWELCQIVDLVLVMAGSSSVSLYLVAWPLPVKYQFSWVFSNAAEDRAGWSPMPSVTLAPHQKKKNICSLVKAVKDMAPRYYIFDAITLHSCVWGQYRKLAPPVAEGTIFLAKELLKTSINDFQFRIFVFVILLFICRLSLFHLTSCSIAWLFYFFVLKNVFLYSIL